MPRHVKANKVSGHQIKKIDNSRNNETVGLEDYINLQTSDEKGLCPLSILTMYRHKHALTIPSKGNESNLEMSDVVRFRKNCLFCNENTLI